MHHWPPQAVAPQTIFLAASGILAVASTNAGFCPPSSRRTGVRFFGGRLHDDLAYLDAPGEEDEVKRKLEKFRNFFSASRDGGNGPRIEVFRYEIQQELTCGGQTLGELEDAWIACRNNVDRRVEEQRQRAVERADHQSDAIRLSDRPWQYVRFPEEPWEQLHPQASSTSLSQLSRKPPFPAGAMTSKTFS